MSAPNHNPHAQFADIVALLTKHRACTLVEPSSQKQVKIEFDGKSRWRLGSIAAWDYNKDALDWSAAGLDERTLLSLQEVGLEPGEDAMQHFFGPNKGKFLHLLKIDGSFNSAEEAAAAAVACFRIAYRTPTDMELQLKR